MEGDQNLTENFEESQFCNDIFRALEASESDSNYNDKSNTNDVVLASKDEQEAKKTTFEFHHPKSGGFQESKRESEAAVGPPNCKRRKVKSAAITSNSQLKQGQEQRMSHVTVERNRRKQMNDSFLALRSLVPTLYVKRSDQASIIGGAVDYIHKLEQLLLSLEAKKQRKVFTEALSPRKAQPSSPHKPWIHQNHQSANTPINNLVATSTSAMAVIEVRISGQNLLLKTASSHIHPGGIVEIVSVIEQLALEILHLKITTVDQTMLNSFTIKIGTEYQLSAQEFAQLIQQTLIQTLVK